MIMDRGVEPRETIKARGLMFIIPRTGIEETRLSSEITHTRTDLTLYSSFGRASISMVSGSIPSQRSITNIHFHMQEYITPENII